PRAGAIEDLALLGGRARTQGRADDAGPLAHQHPHRQLATGAAQGADDDQPPVLTQHRDVVGEHLAAADHVQDHVGPARLDHGIAQLVVWRFQTDSAPNSRTRVVAVSEPTVVSTLAPSSRASWIAVVPMPPVPPWISTVCPSPSPPSITRLDTTVAHTSTMPAASVRSMPSGTGSSWPSGTATTSAYPPPASRARTGSPVSRR